MKIGIVSNSKICIPLLSYLKSYNTKGGVIFYLGNSAESASGKMEIIAFCQANNIAVHIEDKKEELYQWQQLFEPDIIFITGYSSKILTGNLGGVPQGTYNIHFGILPEFRGPSPVFWQLKNGAHRLGITIHQLTDKLDSGPIVWEHTLKNEDQYSYNYLNQIFSELQVSGVLEIINKVTKKITLNKRIQDEARAGYYNKPQLADVMINWEEMNTKEILDLVKACNSWNNGATTLVNGLELKILYAEPVVADTLKQEPGLITISNNNFYVSCVNRSSLSINFFNINNTYIPARHAGFYGLKTGQKFISKL